MTAFARKRVDGRSRAGTLSVDGNRMRAVGGAMPLAPWQNPPVAVRGGGSTAVVSEPQLRFSFRDAALRPTKPLGHIAFFGRQAVDKSTAIPAALALRHR
jgi:hypothetical protein